MTNLNRIKDPIGPQSNKEHVPPGAVCEHGQLATYFNDNFSAGSPLVSNRLSSGVCTIPTSHRAYLVAVLMRIIEIFSFDRS